MVIARKVGLITKYAAVLFYHPWYSMVYPEVLRCKTGPVMLPIAQKQCHPLK